MNANTAVASGFTDPGAPIVRLFSAGDLERILVIRDECIPSFLGASWFSDRPDNVDTFALVAEVDGVVEGFLYYRLRPEGLYVECLVVDAGCRGQGLGKLLLGSLITRAPTHDRTAIRLHVRTFNEPAKQLYFSMNFRVAREMNYFGEPAFLMLYELV